MLQQNCAAGNSSAAIHSTVPDQGLTKSQERAIAALLESRSIESAARRAGVELASLRRWMRDDEGFQSRMSEIRRKAHSDMKKRLREGALKAIDDLIDLVTAKKLVPRGKASLTPARSRRAARAGARSRLGALRRPVHPSVSHYTT